MASKIQFQVNADQVDIEVLWKALTKDIFEVGSKAAPDIFKEWKIFLDDAHADLVLNSVLHITLGTAAPLVEPLKQRVADFDEINHLVSFQGLEGGFLKLGLTSYVLSFKLDYVGEGNSIITATITYDLEKDFDGTQLLEEFTKLVKYYLSTVVSYLQQKINI